jgi:hypothetical protein
MSFWQYFKDYFVQSFRISLEASHIAHQILVILSAVMAIVAAISFEHSSHEEHKEMTWAIITPAIFFLVFLAASFVVYGWKRYREEYDRRIKIEESLKPKLEILGTVSNIYNNFRLRVRNLSAKTLRCRARLQSTIPPIPHPLPILLLPTHSNPQLEAEVTDKGICEFELVCDVGNMFQIQYATNPPTVGNFRKDRRYEIIVSATPSGNEEGTTVYRRFYIITQPDMSIIISDGGEVKPN